MSPLAEPMELREAAHLRNLHYCCSRYFGSILNILRAVGVTLVPFLNLRCLIHSALDRWIAVDFRYTNGFQSFSH